MKKAFVILCVILCSCSSIKERKSQQFFENWHKDSTLFLSKIETLTEIEKDIKTLITIELNNYKFQDYKKDFPKVEYIIFPEHLRISMYKHERNRGLDITNQEGLIFADSLFKNNINFNKLKPLILTESYKNKSPKDSLSYGFGSYYENINRNKAKVILERPYLEKGSKYMPPIEIPYLEFNKALDTAHVFIYHLHHNTEKRYVKQNHNWQLDKDYEFH